jgi:hypothetical protein
MQRNVVAEFVAVTYKSLNVFPVLKVNAVKGN